MDVALFHEFPGRLNGDVDLVLAFLKPLMIHKQLQSEKKKEKNSPSCSAWNDNGFFPRCASPLWLIRRCAPSPLGPRLMSAAVLICDTFIKINLEQCFPGRVNCVHVPEHETFTPGQSRSSAGQPLCEMCLQLHLAF